MAPWGKTDMDLGLVPCDWNKTVKDSKTDPNEPNPVVGKCSQCGLELRKVMMYSCRHTDCPCFHQATL